MSTSTADFIATINQSTVDKVIGSVTYPFQVFDHSWPFTGAAGAAGTYTHAQAVALLDLAVKKGSSLGSAPTDPETAFLSELLNSVNEVLNQQKLLLQDEAVPEAQRKKIQQAVGRGVVGLADLSILKPHLAWLQIKTDKPTIAIASPRTTLSQIELYASATGELWMQYWWFGWKWTRIASITIRGVKFKADAYVDFTAAGTIVQATGAFDKLVLDYVILRDINLASLANGILGSSPLGVYDASKLVATIPLLESHFTVGSLGLPNESGNITVDVTVKQVTTGVR